MFNLLTTRWLPVLKVGGDRALIRPAEIGALDILALDWPRPDFRIACTELLIGLLHTGFATAEHNEWLDRWEQPPSVAELDAAFASFAHAFDLDGDGPRFLQDRENLVSDAEPIERLLIEAPGASTQKNNTDLLVRRGRVAALGRAAATMALYTFQAFAPAGGAGNRTGLRGGGPMSTLVVPDTRPTLWKHLWANVPLRTDDTEWSPADLPRIFPWLAPTVTSEGNRTVTPLDNAHRLQCWWGMPRRIRLDFTPATARETCDLTGVADSMMVRSWRQRPRGANYAGWGRVHPLTPHYASKLGNEFLPVHPQPGGIGYRHWLGLVLRNPDGLRLPAASIADWHSNRQRDVGAGSARLLAAGYDMDNMKARGFVESEMPLPAAPAPAAREAQDQMATALVLSANVVAGLLRTAVRQALFSPGATVKLDAEFFASLRERFWEKTERGFFDLLRRQPEKAMESWLQQLHEVALALFDEAAPLTPEQGNAARRISKARRSLLFTLLGYGKDGNELFGKLALPLPETKAKAPRKKGKAA